MADGSAARTGPRPTIQAGRFPRSVDEAPNHNGPHTSETVSWLVLEAGSWTLPDGTRLEVGTVATAATVGKNVSNSWESITFAEAFGATPVVLSQVQTENDAHWVKTRQRNNSASGFQVALEEEESKATFHGTETIGWLAIEAGQGTWNGHAYEAGKTGDTVTHNWYTIPFGQSFSQAPRALASLASYDGGDNAHLRYRSLTASGVQVKIEEDKTYDSETNHTTEGVHYLAVQGDGALTGQAHETTTKYYHFGGQRVAMRKEGVVYYIAGDHLGTTSVVLNDQGGLVAESRHYPYGAERWTEGTLPTDYRFTGQLFQASLGIYRMGARFYDPSLGRWLSADTIVPEPGNPQSLNRYSYCVGNPLKFIDPSGHYHYQKIHHDLTLKYARKVASNAHALAVTDDKGSSPVSHDEAMKRASTIADRNKGVDLSGRSSLNPIRRSDGRPVGEYWHFTSLEDAESRLLEAVKAKDATAFGRALHAYQDYWSHTRKGFSFLSGDAGEEAIARFCPECSTMMSKGLLQARSSGHGHLEDQWADYYTPDGEIGTVDMDDIWMEQGTEYWLVLFFCELYGIDPQEYWDLYGEIEKPHEYSHLDED